jgi:hypothetical protein
MIDNIQFFIIKPNKIFDNKLKSLIKNKQIDTSLIHEVLKHFFYNPLHPELKTTKVYISKIEYIYYSQLIDDYHIIWKNLGKRNIEFFDLIQM